MFTRPEVDFFDTHIRIRREFKAVRQLHRQLEVAVGQLRRMWLAEFISDRCPVPQIDYDCARTRCVSVLTTGLIIDQGRRGRSPVSNVFRLVIVRKGRGRNVASFGPGRGQGSTQTIRSQGAGIPGSVRPSKAVVGSFRSCARRRFGGTIKSGASRRLPCRVVRSAGERVSRDVALQTKQATVSRTRRSLRRFVP
jgi:hypothetical protein